MGMDVIGRNPVSEQGEYFRNNAWWWRLLADYCMEVAPDITARCKHWHYNEGYGLGARDSLALADILQKEIDSGRCKRWAEMCESTLERLPNEPCRFCEATGTRKPLPEIVPGDEDKFDPRYQAPIELGAGDPANGGFICNVCHGEGYVRPWICDYRFSVENVQCFVTFLRGSGGFSIW